MDGHQSSPKLPVFRHLWFDHGLKCFLFNQCIEEGERNSLLFLVAMIGIVVVSWFWLVSYSSFTGTQAFLFWKKWSPPENQGNIARHQVLECFIAVIIGTVYDCHPVMMQIHIIGLFPSSPFSNGRSYSSRSGMNGFFSVFFFVLSVAVAFACIMNSSLDLANVTSALVVRDFNLTLHGGTRN